MVLTALWPLFHYLLWQDVGSPTSSGGTALSSAAASADTHWPAYEQANAAFARALLDVYQPGDLIWVHDYHLLLVPKMLRQSAPDVCVGLFVHTPWPSSEIFRCLPRAFFPPLPPPPFTTADDWDGMVVVLGSTGRKEILDGMLGANLVNFQTYSYSRHFTSSCVRVCGYEIAARGIDVQGHVTAVKHCPVGVDAERVQGDLYVRSFLPFHLPHSFSPFLSLPFPSFPLYLPP